ncbi:hypothetical protein [Amedibacillus sp. YH-ame10]
MEKIIVSENKIVFIVGIITSTFFSIILGISVLSSLIVGDISSALFCIVVFGFFLMLGIYLLMLYHYHKLRISEEECEYINWLGRKRIFHCKDIRCCEVILSKFLISSVSYRLCDSDKNSLADFKSNMKNASQAIAYFNEKNIAIKSCEANVFVRNSIIHSDENIKEQEIKELGKQMSKTKVKKMKKTIRILSYVHTFLLLIVFVALPIRWVFLIFAISPMLYYFLYLWIYPRMVCEIRKEEKTSWKNSHIKVPFLPILSSIIILLINADTMNLRNEGYFFVLVFIFAIILFIPFVGISKRRDEKIRKGKWILVFLALVAYSFSSMFAWNWISRVKAPVHESAFVVDKKSHRSRNRRDYTIEIRRYNGETTWLTISRSMYETISNKSSVELCKRVSIFGVEYWYVHF